MSRSPFPSHELHASLASVQRVFDEMGADFSGFRARAGELSDRLKQGHFRLAVVGQFKRGKSSLLNALLGEPLLPTGILPLTAIPTALRYGDRRCVCITMLDGQRDECSGSTDEIASFLVRYVTEPENPENRLGVAEVTIEHPAALLAHGVEILDTPGIGSTLLHNTRTAKRRCRLVTRNRGALPGSADYRSRGRIPQIGSSVDRANDLCPHQDGRPGSE